MKSVQGHRLSTSSVKKRLLEEYTAIADAQRMTVRCSGCGWSMKNILVGDGKRAYAQHRELKHADA